MFRQVLQKTSPDLVHFQHLINLSTSLPAMSRDLGIPSVLTLRDFWYQCIAVNLLRPDGTLCQKPDACHECYAHSTLTAYTRRSPQGRLGDDQAQSIRRQLNFPSLQPYEHRNSEMREMLLRKIDLIIAPSRFTQSIYEKCGIPSSKFVFLRNPLTRNITARRTKSEITRFGLVGNAMPIKGFHIAIEAFAMARLEQAQLDIFGKCDYDATYLRQLERLAASHPHIRFHGPFSDPDVPFSNIDVLVAPSLCYENCPNVVLESIAAGVPVIGSEHGGTRELIEEFEAGWLFNPSSVASLANLMRELSGTPESIERKRLSIKGSVPMLSDFVRTLETLYRTTIRNAASRNIRCQ